MFSWFRVGFAAAIALPANPTVEETIANVNINITSVHVAFNTLLPLWRAAGKGTFLLTGGGLGINGAWSVGYGLQFGAAAKA